MSFEYEFIKVDVTEKIGHITLAKPPANAFSSKMYHEVASAVYELGEMKEVAIIVLRAEGKIFCGGNDTGVFSCFDTRTSAEDAMMDCVVPVSAIWNSKKPILAAVQGACMGAGFAMVLCCDFIIGGEGVKFGMPEVKLGIPAAGCFLQLALPIHVAKRLAFTGENVTSEELERWGVVLQTAPREQVWEEADKFAAKIANSCYKAVGVFKQNFNMNVNPHLADKFIYEQHTFMDHMIPSKDFKEAIAAYNEKRVPVFTGE